MSETKKQNILKNLQSNWAAMLCIIAILSMGWNLQAQLQDNLFTKEEISQIATESAERVIYDFEKKDATVDAEDFMRGWIESQDKTMEEYIAHCYESKTRVFKGGLLLVENDYETRSAMEEKYGDHVVNQLIQRLIEFQYS